MKKVLIMSLVLLGLVACQNNEKKEVLETKPVEKKEAKPAFDTKAYKMKGKEIAQGTFKIFKGKIEAIGPKKGLTAVVDFCHENAGKLSDSLGRVHNVVIRRSSHKFRNPENKPDLDEEAVLNEYLRLQEENKPMEPVVMKDSEGYVHFYAPIKLKEKCMQCHGEVGKDIPEEVYKVIKEKYPNDKATGFKTGELRGIWNIKFLDMADK